MVETTFGNVAAVYPVDDVEKAVVWYQQMLGFEAQHINRDRTGEDPTNYAVLQRDRVWLHLVLREEAPGGVMGRAMAQFSITNVDRVFEELRAKGATIMQELADQPWGSRDFHLSDLDGNRVWLSETRR